MFTQKLRSHLELNKTQLYKLLKLETLKIAGELCIALPIFVISFLNLNDIGILRE